MTITKLELQQANARLAQENEALRLENTHLKLDLAICKKQRPFGGQLTPRLEAMQAAREMAVATGKVIKV